MTVPFVYSEAPTGNVDACAKPILLVVENCVQHRPASSKPMTAEIKRRLAFFVFFPQVELCIDLLISLMFRTDENSTIWEVS